MTEYDDLNQEFREKVKMLQDYCPHTKTWWQTDRGYGGLLTGELTKVCFNCHKELETKKDDVG